jgi:hypothetical protein
MKSCSLIFVALLAVLFLGGAFEQVSATKGNSRHIREGSYGTVVPPTPGIFSKAVSLVYDVFGTIYDSLSLGASLLSTFLGAIYTIVAFAYSWVILPTTNLVSLGFDLLLTFALAPLPFSNLWTSIVLVLSKPLIMGLLMVDSIALALHYTNTYRGNGTTLYDAISNDIASGYTAIFKVPFHFVTFAPSCAFLLIEAARDAASSMVIFPQRFLDSISGVKAFFISGQEKLHALIEPISSRFVSLGSMAVPFVASLMTVVGSKARIQ